MIEPILSQQNNPVGRPEHSDEQYRFWLEDMAPFLKIGNTLHYSIEKAMLMRHKTAIYGKYRLKDWFSEKIDAYCTSNGHTCTIWVDDIIISGPKSETLIQEVKRLINKRGLRIGWKKLKIQRNHKQAQEVTGVVVNNKLSVSKKKRRAYAKTAILARTDKKLAETLKGQLASLQFINPNQGKQLIKLASKQK